MGIQIDQEDVKTTTKNSGTEPLILFRADHAGCDTSRHVGTISGAPSGDVFNARPVDRCAHYRAEGADEVGRGSPGTYRTRRHEEHTTRRSALKLGTGVAGFRRCR